jgi:HEAT repeat protein
MTLKSLSLATFLACLCLAPARAQDYEADVAALIPKLADSAVGNRYAAQMQLQALASDASKPGNDANRLALGKILAAKAADTSTPQPARVWIVRQLQYMGGTESVPALAGLLKESDAELRDSARRALEQNPDPSAGSSLLAVLAQADNPAWKCAFLHSLGQRRDAAAVNGIAPALKDEATLGSAAEALGNIASPEAVQALQAAPPSPATGTALITAAQRCPAETAAAIYGQLLASSKFTPVRAAALRGLAKTAPDKFAPLVKEAVSGADAVLREAALDGCAALPTGAVMLAQALPELPPAVRVRALNAVEQWELKTAIEQTLEADPDVRAAAFAALARMGSPESTLLLIKTAASGEAADRPVAQTALNATKSPQSLAEIRKAAASSEAAMRMAALNALVARRDSGSLALYVAILRDKEGALRRPALTALRQLGGGAELEAVAQFAVATGSPEAVEAAVAMAGRATDPAAAANQVLAATGGHPEAIALLAETFAALGGAPALDAVAAAATQAKPENRAAAIAALGNWTDLDAAKPLLGIATDSQTSAKLQSAALAALAQLVRNSDTAPLADREAALLPALPSARQLADRKAMLAALATVPTVAVGEALRPVLADATLRSEAALAAIAVAEGLAKSDRTAARSLAAAVKAAGPGREVLSRAEKLLR